MAAEIKKEIQLEIAHVLFTDIVGYSKLPIHQQRAVVERLNEIVRGTDEFQAAETAGRLIKIPTGDARWKLAARSRSIRNFSCEWAYTVDP